MRNLVTTLVLGLMVSGVMTPAAQGQASDSNRDAINEKEWSWWPPWPFNRSEEKAKVNQRGTLNTKTLAPSGTGRIHSKPRPSVHLNRYQREHDKVMRRQLACDRLCEIAGKLKDPSLEKQARLLQERAWLIYEQRTSLDGSAMALKSPEVQQKGGKEESDSPTDVAQADR